MVQSLKKKVDVNSLRFMLGDEWFSLLSPFIRSEPFRKILERLKYELNFGNEITPNVENIFRAFKECPFSIMHSIIMVTEPYSALTDKKEPIADGLAISAKEAVISPFAIRNVHGAIEEYLNGEGTYYIPENCDLTHWANQGILLLNCSLTMTRGQGGSHCEVWYPFMVYLMHVINKNAKDLGIITMGKYPLQFIPMLKNKTFQFFNCADPTDHNFSGVWNHNGVFKDLSNYQQSQGLYIQW